MPLVVDQVFPPRKHSLVSPETRTPVPEECIRQWNTLLDGRLQDQRNRSAALGSRQVHLSSENAKCNRAEGDILTDKLEDSLRLFFLNVNGFQLDAEGGDFREFCHVARET